MSVVPSAGNGKVTVPSILQRKSGVPRKNSSPAKITCLTAYDYPTARLLDEAGVDILLVGDSLAMVVLGYESTLPVTLEEMLHHTRAVRRGTRHALLVADMPYGSYHDDPMEAVRHAVRFVKEAGAEAVKIEGGERRMDLITRLVEAEIPVMGHIGLTPQSVNAFGGFRVQGKTEEAGEQLLARCARRGSRGSVRHRAGIDSAGARGENHRRVANPHDRHRRGTGLRRPGPGDQRSAGPELWPPAEIRAALLQCWASHIPGSFRIYSRCSTGKFSRGRRVVSSARRPSRRTGHAAPVGVEELSRNSRKRFVGRSFSSDIKWTVLGALAPDSSNVTSGAEAHFARFLRSQLKLRPTRHWIK